MIHVRGLTKSYLDGRNGVRLALTDVTFDVFPGQIYGILGANGAGKTTLLRILSTLLRPTGGAALVNGFDVLQEPIAVRRQIGFVSNNLAVYSRLTAAELVTYYGRLHDVPADVLDGRMESIFTQLGMQEIRDMLCGKMSSGMRQKVSIARALIHDPPILIFDEPTVGLDILVARSLLEIVRAQRDRGKCVLFSTHIMREVERICDRVAILHRGQMLAEGPLVQLLDENRADDLEELFFSLVSSASPQPLGTATAPSSLLVNTMGAPR